MGTGEMVCLICGGVGVLCEKYGQGLEGWTLVTNESKEHNNEQGPVDQYIMVPTSLHQFITFFYLCIHVFVSSVDVRQKLFIILLSMSSRAQPLYTQVLRWIREVPTLDASFFKNSMLAGFMNFYKLVTLMMSFKLWRTQSIFQRNFATRLIAVH